jgi:hypothetical protein
MKLALAISAVVAYVVLFDVILPLWWAEVEHRWKQEREREWHV